MFSIDLINSSGHNPPSFQRGFSSRHPDGLIGAFYSLLKGFRNFPDGWSFILSFDSPFGQEGGILASHWPWLVCFCYSKPSGFIISKYKTQLDLLSLNVPEKNDSVQKRKGCE